MKWESTMPPRAASTLVLSLFLGAPFGALADEPADPPEVRQIFGAGDLEGVSRNNTTTGKDLGLGLGARIQGIKLADESPGLTFMADGELGFAFRSDGGGGAGSISFMAGPNLGRCVPLAGLGGGLELYVPSADDKSEALSRGEGHGSLSLAGACRLSRDIGAVLRLKKEWGVGVHQEASYGTTTSADRIKLEATVVLPRHRWDFEYASAGIQALKESKDGHPAADETRVKASVNMLFPHHLYAGVWVSDTRLKNITPGAFPEREPSQAPTGTATSAAGIQLGGAF